MILWQPRKILLPFLVQKSAAMDALKDTYSTTDSATSEIKNKIVKFYQSKYPDVFKKSSKEILLP